MRSMLSNRTVLTEALTGSLPETCIERSTFTVTDTDALCATATVHANASIAITVRQIERTTTRRRMPSILYYQPAYLEVRQQSENPHRPVV